MVYDTGSPHSWQMDSDASRDEKMPMASHRASNINSAMINRSGDISKILEKDWGFRYLNSPAQTYNQATNPAVEILTKKITVPKST